jgi:sugar porter (SP) family MFS transporter
MYIAEITPARLRGRLVAINQIAIVTGLTLVYFVNYAIAQHGDQAWSNEMSWRWMFASGLFPAAVLALLLVKIPESPRWLMERKRESDARVILDRIGGPAFAETEIASIRSALSVKPGIWGEPMSRKLSKPLGIGILLAVLQQVTGINVFMYFGTTLFKNLSQSTGVDSGMIQQSLIGLAGIFFTVIAMAVVDRGGRKPLMFIGTLGMFISLVAMGIMAQSMKDPATAGTPMLLCIIFYLGCFSLSAGPIIWVILSEIFPLAVRGRALGLAIFCMWMADYAVTQTFPMMDNNVRLVEKFNHAFPFYLYAFFCLLLIALMFFIPETKGKSLEEIEQNWAKSQQHTGCP